MNPKRRAFMAAGVGVGAASLMQAAGVCAQTEPLLQKKIPSSGESIPIIGIGTARRYEGAQTVAEKAPLRETIRQFKQLGGKVIDTAPTYGSAEEVVGKLVDEFFLAPGGRERSAAGTWTAFLRPKPRSVAD